MCDILLKLSNGSRLALDGEPEHDFAFNAHRNNAPVHDKRGFVALVVDSFACGERLNQAVINNLLIG